MKINILYCIIILAFTFTSCKTTRSIIKAPLKEQGSSLLFNNLKANELHFKTLKASFSAEYVKNKKKTSIKGTILINKDSLIWCSIGPGLYIELVRLAITPDSIKIINKMSKTYLLQNFDFISEMINKGLDFDMLQSLLIGNDFSVYDNSSFKAAVDKNQYRLSTLNRRRLRKLSQASDTLTDVIPFQQIYLDPVNFKISTVIIKEIDKNNRTFQAYYKNYIDINKQIIPQTIEFNVNDGENKIHIVLSLSKIRINPDQSYPFNIPSEYKRIDRF